MTDKIRAEYEQLDAIANLFGQQGEVSTELYTRVQQSFAALEQGGWEGRGSQAFFSEMQSKIFPAMQGLTHALEEGRAVTLETIRIFQQADEEAGRLFSVDGTGGGGESGFDVKAAQSSLGKASMLYGAFNTLQDSANLRKLHNQLYDHLKEFNKGNYDNYDDFLKKLALVPAGSTGRRIANLAKDEAIGSIVPKSALGVAFQVGDVALRTLENWQEYEGLDTVDRLRKTAIGATVDTSLNVGITALGTYGGAALGGLIGSVGGPIGTAIGAKVGGFLGGLAGGWVAGKIQESGFNDAVVDFVDRNVEQGIDAVSNFAGNVARRADRVLDSLAGGLSSLW